MSVSFKNIPLTRAKLSFADGVEFLGNINLATSDPRLNEGIWGEAAFTTAMTGYQETMTDPSYLGQHLIFAANHIGNYPLNESRDQSKKIHCKTIIARYFSDDFYQKMNDKAILFTTEDTRQLICYLSQHSSHHQSVISLPEKKFDQKDYHDATKLDCHKLSLVSCDTKKVISSGNNPIVIIDYGIKNSIILQLQKYLKKYIEQNGLVIMPYHSSAQEILGLNPSLVFLSNGPGDPQQYRDQIHVVGELLKAQIPLRGICLGHQLLGLALGAKTFKLPFGQRGINHPVFDHTQNKVIITSQNHGYAIEEQSFLEVSKKRPAIFISGRSLFDHSIASLESQDGLYRSVQYHPEGHPGPHDGEDFFVEIDDYLHHRARNRHAQFPLPQQDKLTQKSKVKYEKILLIGSGPIKIGQASEFDYSGTQACKALRELGIEVVLLNSNPATIMTDVETADRTYIEPITKEVIAKIIEREKVDGVLSTMGGQTALNICIELEEEDFLKSRGVDLLGAKVDTIKKTEDRDLFAKELKKLGYHTGQRYQADGPQNALKLAQEKVGLPLIMRRDFELGGKGSALVKSIAELKEVLSGDITYPITMEKSLVGWKEVELEVMVDQDRNGVIVCSIENIDPCGIHTGDSITVAPAQTISDHCYQNLRTMALKIATHMEVVAGGANVQFAINPHNEDEIVVIEMNPRVSRSSALASKATGYPIAKISAALAVGLRLCDIQNDITESSPVSFEPTLDYVAVKIPLFPFNKFPSSSRELGPQMRSVGEVLGLGGSFNEAMMKALRSLEMGLEVPSLRQLATTPFDMDKAYIKDRLSKRRELSVITCLEALRQEISIDEINQLSAITPWFIKELEKIVLVEKEIQNKKKDIIQGKEEVERFLHYKRQGLSDKHISLLSEVALKEILNFRFEHQLFPGIMAVDTCSGEFQAKTPYFYTTWHRQQNSSGIDSHAPLEDKAVAIFGSGPNRIGQGIEFDYSCVKAAMVLKKLKKKSLLINSNPETVSTDYDCSDRLYLSPLYSEDLFNILTFENPLGVIASFSGQSGIKIRNHLERGIYQQFKSFSFLGPNLETIDFCEDRKLFDSFSRDIGLDHTTSIEIKGIKQLHTAIAEIGLPVIIRPSFVIGGESMFIFKTLEDIEQLPLSIKEQLKNSQTVFQVENYLENTLEFDIDLVRDKKGQTVLAACEHIEHAGVHSGDSGMMTPPIKTPPHILTKVEDLAHKLAEKLEIIGPINFQFAVDTKKEKIYCIEANPRGSRTLPFLAKACGVDLPGLATGAFLSESFEQYQWKARPIKNLFCAKQSSFPFDRFVGDNIILGPKMRSTGETMGIDKDPGQALLKSYLGNYPRLKKSGKIMLSLNDQSKNLLIEKILMLSKLTGISFYATHGTHLFLKERGISSQCVDKIEEKQKNNISILQGIQDPQLIAVFNTPTQNEHSKADGEMIRNNAIIYARPCFTRNENIEAIIEALISWHTKEITPTCLQDNVNQEGHL